MTELQAQVYQILSQLPEEKLRPIVALLRKMVPTTNSDTAGDGHEAEEHYPDWKAEYIAHLDEKYGPV